MCSTESVPLAGSLCMASHTVIGDGACIHTKLKLRSLTCWRLNYVFYLAFATRCI